MWLLYLYVWKQESFSYTTSHIFLFFGMSRFLVSVGIMVVFFTPIHILSGYSLQDSIELSWKNYSYGELSLIIDGYLPSEVLLKSDAYDALISTIAKRELSEIDNEKKEYYRKIGEVIQIGKNAHKYILNSQVHEIPLGYSQWGREIKWYFKWDPNDGFHLITANIHGSYEYGTYETALMLIDELKSSDQTGWFIIPTLNPDGLIEYEERWTYLNAYLESRDNLNGVDLNRNFCSKNFRDIEFSKYWKVMQTATAWCESEMETKVMVETLEKFYFKTAISLHSVGGIIYIPDGSVDDESVIRLWKKVISILPWYDFYPNTSSQILRQASIKKYEIDEWDSWLFTGTLETYMYEKFGIPNILIELSNHWKIEYNLREIFTLDL